MPQTAMSLSGHVVITFDVHRRGTLTDVRVLQPSVVQSFTSAAANALEMTNPTDPLPSEYPTDHCTFTITFFYNERPPDY
jgi:TonB family protein